MYIHKSMMPVGPKQKPVLEYIIRLLAYYGIKDVVLAVGYKAEQIQGYFDDGSRFGVGIRYVKDKEKLGGTGGAVINVINSSNLEYPVIVYFGDILTNIDIKSLISYHNSKGSDVTVVISKKYQVPTGIVELEGEDVIKFKEYPELGKPVHIGIDVLSEKACKFILNYKEGEDVNFSGDIIPYLISEGLKVKAYMTHMPWYDVGSIERYAKLPNDELQKMFSHIS